MMQQCRGIEETVKDVVAIGTTSMRRRGRKGRRGEVKTVDSGHCCCQITIVVDAVGATMRGLADG